jgi:cytochrome c oxidase assembly protein subunit 15
MAHRGAALLAGISALTLAWNLRRLGAAGRRLCNLLLLALTAQFLLGVGLVALRLPLSVAVLHNLGAAVLVLALVATQRRLSSRKIREAPSGATDNAPGPATSGC